MNERKYEQLEDMLCAELEDIINKGELSAGDLEVVDKLTHALKNTYKIHMGYEGEYSNATEGGNMNGGYGGYGIYAGASYNSRRREGGNSYRGNSYARGRTGNVKRDSMGRYSRADAKEEMIDKLEEMMENAESEKEREALRNCMMKIENS